MLLLLKLRASLLGGIITLALLELPIMVRGMEEMMSMVPFGLKEASHALGATRLETALRVLVRQAAPGIVTVLLLAFGRGIGDAASVLFTAGYTDRMPNSLLRPVASLPLAVSAISMPTSQSVGLAPDSHRYEPHNSSQSSEPVYDLPYFLSVPS